MDSYLAAILLRRAYEIRYDIHNHEDPTARTPMGLVAYREAESYREHGSYMRGLRMYVDLGIYQHTGISWDALIKLPRFEYEEIIKICLKKNEKHTRDDERHLKNLIDKTPGLKNLP